MPAEPVDAATVIYLRPPLQASGGNFEVLMVLRHPDSKFVPDSYVFPGGCLDPEDYDSEMGELSSGLTLTHAQSILGDISSPEKALGFWVTGIRETFEEVGILLAYQNDGSIVSFASDNTIQLFRTYRMMLQAGEISLKTIFKKEGMKIASDRLHYYSNWITPELLPLRYNVRFFIAEAPREQTAFHDGIELTRHIWITPRAMLDGFHRKEFNMVVPTLVTIEELSRHETIDDVIASTRNKEIKPILTVMVQENGGIVEYMPDGRVFRNMPPSILS